MNTQGGRFEPERDIASIIVNRWNYGYAYELCSTFDPSLYGPVAEQPQVLGRKPYKNVAKDHHHPVRDRVRADRAVLPPGELKLIPVSLTPLGRDIVDIDQAQRLGYESQVAMPVNPSRPS